MKVNDDNFNTIVREISYRIVEQHYFSQRPELCPVHRYCVDIFSYSGLSGILGSGGKQNVT